MRALVFATVALAALWWPGRVAGMFDGAPLTGQPEAILLGFIAPILWWCHRGFFRGRAAQVAVAALVILKIAAAFPTQEGWCVRFDPHRPIVRDSTGRPHSWDVRADWRSPNPSCSAVMTTPYTTFKEFPAWFFNLPPIDDNLPLFEDRPPGATTDLTITGFINASGSGLLEVVTGPGMAMTVVVDGKPADHPNELSHRIQLDAGVHFVQATGTLTENHWQFMPSWNRALFGSSGFPTATMARPAAIDRPVIRSALGWLTSLTVVVLMIAWTVSALIAAGTPPMMAWAVLASALAGYLAPRVGNGFVTSGLARMSMIGLIASCWISVPAKHRTLRGLFLLAVVPFLAFIGTASVDHAGKFSLYSAGDDWWMYQRLSYRTYLEGFFLEGGQRAFVHQPLYRWIAGGLHMLFGDSSMGEFLWDGSCFAAMALFAGEFVRRLFGLRWAIVAASVTLALVMLGPTWDWWGAGLSENSSAGLICMAAIAAITAEGWNGWLTAGLLAALGFYSRLNNLPIAIAVAAFAIPIATPASDWIRPAKWLSSINARGAFVVIGSVAAGMFLLALRNWHYNGVLSMTYGSQLSMLSIWQPGLSMMEIARRMFDSVWMVLTINDPPRVSWYSIPVLSAVLSIGALIGLPILRQLSLPLIVFFWAGTAGSLVARGSAYSGRFSTIVIGAACAVCISAAAVLLTYLRPMFSYRTAGN